MVDDGGTLMVVILSGLPGGFGCLGDVVYLEGVNGIDGVEL